MAELIVWSQTIHLGRPPPSSSYSRRAKARSKKSISSEAGRSVETTAGKQIRIRYSIRNPADWPRASYAAASIGCPRCCYTQIRSLREEVLGLDCNCEINNLEGNKVNKGGRCSVKRDGHVTVPAAGKSLPDTHTLHPRSDVQVSISNLTESRASCQILRRDNALRCMRGLNT
ncbi:uncharacterized protein BO66DRAFT_94532 [Aspergillus aculeatinus CBS 121060]|uniref:Uncharacterized protein n=1 Tax=Aspergillus aculeatinus CBS 121060 TaxID=1448322 RepID=A0ACD1H887_9EURO|nr:hypothetical protein BO66DRAFT_94532 [Aspergillus aculeatinus CBS 121060]RAH69703.1 hypothetical protein BO66DRAFT_94532 [Aspergillus aculeatinus CBS 121060]